MVWSVLVLSKHCRSISYIFLLSLFHKFKISKKILIKLTLTEEKLCRNIIFWFLPKATIRVFSAFENCKKIFLENGSGSDRIILQQRKGYGFESQPIHNV